MPDMTVSELYQLLLQKVKRNGSMIYSENHLRFSEYISQGYYQK